MIFNKEPGNFNPIFSVVGCFCGYKGKIILLHRHASQSQGLKWGVPSGKIESKEKPEDAALRELQEETGIELKKEKIKYFSKVYVRYPDYDFIYHIFHTELTEKVDVKIRASEHTGFIWITPKKALDLKLVPDLDACIRLFYRIK